jgi:hypothetical protein
VLLFQGQKEEEEEEEEMMMMMKVKRMDNMQRESVRPPRQSDRTVDPEGNKKKKNLLLAHETAGASLCIHAWSAAESIYPSPPVLYPLSPSQRRRRRRRRLLAQLCLSEDGAVCLKTNDCRKCTKWPYSIRLFFKKNNRGGRNLVRFKFCYGIEMLFLGVIVSPPNEMKKKKKGELVMPITWQTHTQDNTTARPPILLLLLFISFFL